MKYVSAFDSKTLHDGSSRRSQTPLPINVAADVEIEEMANGSLFDPNYGTGSPVKPKPFSALFFMRFDTAAEAEAEIAAIKAKIGDTGDVTASFTSGATAETCTATLERAQDVFSSNGRAFKLTLFFVPFTDWS